MKKLLLSQKKKDLLSTKDVVPEMISIELTEESELPMIVSGKKYAFHLKGPSAWIAKTRKNLAGHKIKTTFTDSTVRAKNGSRKTDNIKEFINKSNFKSDKEKMLIYIESL